MSPIALKDPRDLVYIYRNDSLIYYTKSDYFNSIAPDESEIIHNGVFTFTENNYTFRELCISRENIKIRVIRNINSELSSLKQLFITILIGIIISIIITYFIALYLTRKALIPIETAWNNQAKFIQDASHELRTPITVVSSKLQRLLTVPNNTINDEVETIADMMSETRRLKKIIQDLLTLTKEDAVVKINVETFDLEELLSEIYKDYVDISQVQNKNMTFSTNINNKIIKSDRLKLRQLIILFIDNAFKYTNENDRISISLEELDNKIVCNIKDSGIGIKEEDLPYIFDRFFRSDNVRSQDIDGSGIGLSIAKMLSISLNCTIDVKSKIGEGTSFKINIPRQISNKN